MTYWENIGWAMLIMAFAQVCMLIVITVIGMFMIKKNRKLFDKWDTEVSLRKRNKNLEELAENLRHSMNHFKNTSDIWHKRYNQLMVERIKGNIDEPKA